jgi:hypothetical protein
MPTKQFLLFVLGMDIDTGKPDRGQKMVT